MSPVRIVEPELQQPPPRPVRLMASGRRDLLYPVFYVLILLVLCAWAYAGRPAAGAMMPLFVVFSGLGVYLIVRLLEALHERTLLVREGRTASAVVISVSQSRDGRSKFVGWYEAGGKQWSISWTDWEDAAEIGDAVTLLHLPDDPGRAMIYRTAGCKAVMLPHPESENMAADQSPLTPRI